MSEPTSASTRLRPIFGVITHVPPPEDKGNLALAFPLFVDRGQGYEAPVEPVGFQIALNLRSTVFALGEILVLDSDGREVSGRGRKPSKWYVTCEEFDTVEAAVARAQEVSA